MAKRIIQALVGILILLVCLVVHFIQVNDHKMIMLVVKMAVSAFGVFYFVSRLFYMADHQDKPIWKKTAKAGVYLILAYPVYLLLEYIVSYSVGRDQVTGLSIDSSMSFFEYSLGIVLGAIVLAAVLYGLRGIRRPV